MTLGRRASVDGVLLGLVAGLTVFGLLMLVSATGPEGWERHQDTYWFFKHQLLFGLMPGVVLCVLTTLIPYTLWRRLAGWMLVASIGLLVLVFVPGVGADFGTAHSWISVFGYSFQPSEIVKLTFLLYLAAWLEARSSKDLERPSSGLLPFVAVLGVIMLLMILQPDVGTMAVVVAIAGVMYFVAGAPWSHLSLLLGVGVMLFALLITIAPYRASRFTTFLHPELDPQGVGYHINQAFLAIGSGGAFGLGYGHSRQKYEYLPEVMGDSIFAVIAEEMGFFLTAGVVVAFGALAWRLLGLSASAPDEFARLVVIGVATWIMFQAGMNIAAMLGLMPITGVPLPFVSYGGTSLTMLLAACGIVFNISRSKTG